MDRRHGLFLSKALFFQSIFHILGGLKCDKDIDACKCAENTYNLSNRSGISGLRLRKLRFKNDTTCINFNNNNIPKLSCEDFSPIPSSVKSLYLRNCKIKSIDCTNIFENLTKLMVFDIGSNELQTNAFINIFMSVKRASKIVPLSLNISGNELSENYSYSFLRDLQEFRADGCKINNLHNILETNETNKRLRLLSLQHNQINETSLEAFYNHGEHYEMLDSLLLSYNPVKSLTRTVFSKLKKLRNLWITNFFAFNATFPGLNCPRLNILDISHSFSFSPVEEVKSVFNISRNISNLVLSGTDLVNWTENDLLQLLNPLTDLTELNLNKTSLTEIPCDLLRTQTSLKFIGLSENFIVGWFSNCFENMPKSLEKIYLRQNRITIINETSFPPEFVEKLKHLYLNGNLFKCDCSTHWFRSWMRDHYGILDALSEDKSTPFYECHSPKNNGSLLVDFDPTYEECHGLSISELLSLSISGFCFVLILTLNALTRLNNKKRGERYQSYEDIDGWAMVKLS
ncbi:toll-like receptor 7 [Mytilus trossulus]|uniref:toll-like receptor 7 n=1 Tax=Mytilus trossulus TaxID=6551 RepID=UPI0030051BF5